MSQKKTMIKLSDVDIAFHIQENGFVSLKDFALNLGKHSFLKKKYILKDIDLEIYEGECVGLLGKNGSGKSTLLRTLSGIIIPTKGKIDIRGSVAPLLGLGVGLEKELNGIENIKLLCALMGMTKKEIKDLMPGIIEFSELGDAVNWQVKRYSTGMTSRLAFSIAIMKNPDILLIDEVLSVGDIGFQRKCQRKVEEIMSNGATVIFVSHAFEEVQRMCNRAVLINEGSIQLDGTVDEVGKHYHSLFD
jgi:ABC-type polysaccharide/polyol phosphate transport system ATPase subunit